MTREQIRAKYGIIGLEHPDIAHQELSEKDAAAYENLAAMSGREKL